MAETYNWNVTPKHTIPSEELVAIITNPTDWRAGQIAAVTQITADVDQTFFNLRFYDMYTHTFSISRRQGPPTMEIYYRKLPGNETSQRLMDLNGRGLTHLVERYKRLQAIQQMGWLNEGLLRDQYALIFGQEFPIRTKLDIIR